MVICKANPYSRIHQLSSGQALRHLCKHNFPHPWVRYRFTAPFTPVAGASSDCTARLISGGTRRQDNEATSTFIGGHGEGIICAVPVHVEETENKRKRIPIAFALTTVLILDVSHGTVEKTTLSRTALHALHRAERPLCIINCAFTVMPNQNLVNH